MFGKIAASIAMSINRYKITFLAAVVTIAVVLFYFERSRVAGIAIYRVTLTKEQLDSQFLTPFTSHGLPVSAISESQRLHFNERLQSLIRPVRPIKTEYLIFYSVASQSVITTLRSKSALVECPLDRLAFSCSAESVDANTHDLNVIYRSERQSIWLWNGEGALIGVKSESPNHLVTYYLICRATMQRLVAIAR